MNVCNVSACECWCVCQCLILSVCACECGCVCVRGGRKLKGNKRGPGAGSVHVVNQVTASDLCTSYYQVLSWMLVGEACHVQWSWLGRTWKWNGAVQSRSLFVWGINKIRRFKNHARFADSNDLQWIHFLMAAIIFLPLWRPVFRGLSLSLSVGVNFRSPLEKHEFSTAPPSCKWNRLIAPVTESKSFQVCYQTVR